jgi:hypothetical protein
MSHTSGLVANTMKVFKCIGSHGYPDQVMTSFELILSVLAIAVCSLFLLLSLTTVSAQIPPPEATLTANPVF